MSTLKIALLWHYHQPSYWDPQNETYRYPWVFLHTARHYHSMAVISSEHPEAKVTFNFTPVLIEQLTHYCSERPFRDRILEAMLRPAEDLSEEDLDLVLDHVFRLPLRTMISPFPRYRELHGLFGNCPLNSSRHKVTARDVRDLQTLYLLTWCGTALHQTDTVRSIVEKGEDYSEEDREAVFETMLGAVRQTLTLYRDLQEVGGIEVSTTPYYHPILPLVIDSDVARESRHDVDLDSVEFRHPADAAWHVEAAAKSYREHFHRDPRGMWPSEGSVSDAALQLIADHKFRWAGADEATLGRSLGRALSAQEKHRPYQFAGTDLWVYFRDRELSDRIGFVYSGWEPEKAADDVIGRLLAIRDNLGGDAAKSCVTIILDGENPWEHYPDSGLGFLHGLYSRLENTSGLEPVLFGDHRDEADAAPSLSHVVPGSWIGSNFDTWIGCPEKNHAWKVLALSRRELEVEAPEAPPPVEIYRAEGSDWFWWLGPGHDTPYESSYEKIFRVNLRNGLEKVGVKPPAILEQSVAPQSTPLFQPPIHLTSPRIDGRPGNYYDWIAAGYQLASEGSFHRIHRHLERIRFGFDLDNLYLRIEGDLEALKQPLRKVHVNVRFDRPAVIELQYSGGKLDCRDASGKAIEFHGKVTHDVFLELMIPFDGLGAQVDDLVEFAVTVVTDSSEADRLPQSGTVSTKRPGADFGLENWSA